MGLLRDYIERKHQDTRDQQFREFDTWKNILGDQRGVEAGGFSDDQKNDALNRILTIASPSKKHADAMRPMFQALTGLGAPQQPASAPSAQSPAQPSTGTNPSTTPAASPSSLINPPSAAPYSPAKMAGVEPTPQLSSPNLTDLYPREDQYGRAVSTMHVDGQQHGVVTDPAIPQVPNGGALRYDEFGRVVGHPDQEVKQSQLSLSPPAKPEPQAQVHPQPQPQPQPQPPVQPQPSRGTGVFATPTMDERMAVGRKKQEYTAETALGIEKKKNAAEVELDTQKRQQMIKRYQEAKAAGFSEPEAMTVAGFTVPSGAYTGASRAVSKNSLVQRTNPLTHATEVGYQTPNGFQVMPGAEMPKPTAAPHVPSVPEQGREDQLQAYADRLNSQHANEPNWVKRTRESLTAQEKMDAVSHATGPLKPLEDALRGQHPEWTPDQVKSAASKQYLDSQAQIGKGREVSIHLNQGKVDEQNRPLWGDVPTRTPGLGATDRDETMLSTRPTGEQLLVKAVADYEQPITPYMLGRDKGKWANLFALAKQYDPTFDESQYQIRQGVKRAFSTGKEAGFLRSLNTVVGHMDTLGTLGKALGNNDIQSVNKVINTVRTWAGKANVNNFDMAANAVIDEMANVFKQSGVTDQSVNQWKTSIGHVQSPSQMTGAIQTGVELLGSRVYALRQQWHQTMGDKPLAMLSPKAKGVLQRMGVDVEALDPTPQTQQSAQPNPQAGAGQGQGSGEAQPQAKAFASGGFSYTPAWDIPQDMLPAVKEGLKDGKAHILDVGGRKFTIKLFEGNVYTVVKSAGGK